MGPDRLAGKAMAYLERLCAVVPNRRTGSVGNRAATDFFADVIRGCGFAVDQTPFECLDYVRGASRLVRDGASFPVQASPYTLGCDVTAELTAVSTLEELEAADCVGKILLMRGPICAEKLMPKNFVFYNPERHQRIIASLEQKAPAAIVTATGKNPELAGALDPFPLIGDGDFDIPSVFCTESVGEALMGMVGESFHLRIEAQRVPSTASNVVAQRNQGAARKIVVTAHIDAYEDSPGAVDNASGTVVLLLLAEMLSDYEGEYTLEIVAINGEDHYSAGGEMDYLRRYGEELSQVLLAVNIDGVGYQRGGSAYSFYGCSPEVEGRARGALKGFDGLLEGEAWFAGDHMVFVQAGVPSVAFTAELAGELTRTVTHTSLDTPELIEGEKLVEVALGLDALVRALSGT